MPYIEQSSRERIDKYLNPVLEEIRKDAEDCEIVEGELNYILTKIIMAYIGDCKCYASFNQVLGVLDSASREFYRRVVGPYEQEKMKTHGDVY